MTRKSNTQLLKLLTPELKAKVEKKTKECFALATKHFKTEFPDLEIRYDIKNWVGGYAYRNRNLVRYNLILLVENEDHFIENVVPHEVAHIVNFRVNKPAPGKKRLMPHGKEWKSIMKDVFKVEPAVKHNYDCSSIEKSAKRKSHKAARVDNALKVIRHILERANKKYTPEELHRFNRELDNLIADHQDGGMAEAA
jgi:predicted SprT family Zn-dependent metalloprotease